MVERTAAIVRVLVLTLFFAFAPGLGANIVDGEGTVTLDIDIRSTEDIIVKDTATLVLRDMELDMNQAYDDELIIRVEGRGRLILSNVRISSNKHIVLTVLEGGSLEATNSTIIVDELLTDTTGTVTFTDSSILGFLTLKADRVTLLRSRLLAQRLDIQAMNEAKIDGCPDVQNLHTLVAPYFKILDSVIVSKETLELKGTATSSVIANLTATAPAIRVSSGFELEVRDSWLSAKVPEGLTLVHLIAPTLLVSTSKMEVAEGHRAGILLRGASVDVRNLTVAGSCDVGCANITLEVKGKTLILRSIMANLKGGSAPDGTGSHGANATVIIAGDRMTAADLTFTLIGGYGGDGRLIGGNGGNATALFLSDEASVDGGLVSLNGGEGGDGGFDPGVELRLGGNGGHSSMVVRSKKATLRDMTYNGLGGFPGDAGKGPGLCGDDIITIEADKVTVIGTVLNSNGGKGREPNYQRKDSHGCDGRVTIAGKTLVIEHDTFRATGGDCAPSTEWAAVGGNGLVAVTGEQVNIMDFTVRANGGSGGIGKEHPSFRSTGWANLTLEGSTELSVLDFDVTANTRIESQAGTLRDLTLKGTPMIGGTLSLINPRLNDARSPLLEAVQFPSMDRYILKLEVTYYLDVTVKDKEGKAIPGARVALYEPLGTEPVYVAYSDIDGHARVEAQAEQMTRNKDKFQGNFRVVATALGAKAEKGLILDISKTMTLTLDAVYQPEPTAPVEPGPDENVTGGTPGTTPVPLLVVPTPFPTPTPHPVTAIRATPPPDPADMAARARALVKTQPLRALVLADEALAVDPSHQRARLQRATALEALERYKEAQLMYELVLIDDPDDAEMRARLEEVKVKAQELASMAEAGEAPEDATGMDTWTIITFLVGLLVVVFIVGVVMVIMSNPAQQDRETVAIRSFTLQWTQQGYTTEQIREYLLGMGYPPEKIDTVLIGK